MKNVSRQSRFLLPALLALVLLPQVAFAQDVSEEMFTVNNTWMLVATFLVFIMHLGFACLESGLTQAKNTVNILFKNTGVVAIGLLTYAICGFNLMYPGDFSIGQYFGFAGMGIDPGVDGNTIAYADGASSSKPCSLLPPPRSFPAQSPSGSNWVHFYCSQQST